MNLGTGRGEVCRRSLGAAEIENLMASGWVRIPW